MEETHHSAWQSSGNEPNGPAGSGRKFSALPAELSAEKLSGLFPGQDSSSMNCGSFPSLPPAFLHPCDMRVHLKRWFGFIPSYNIMFWSTSLGYIFLYFQFLHFLMCTIYLHPFSPKHNICFNKWINGWISGPLCEREIQNRSLNPLWTHKALSSSSNDSWSIFQKYH